MGIEMIALTAVGSAWLALVSWVVNKLSQDIRELSIQIRDLRKDLNREIDKIYNNINTVASALNDHRLLVAEQFVRKTEIEK